MAGNVSQERYVKPQWKILEREEAQYPVSKLVNLVNQAHLGWNMANLCD
jgi:hypothetical protein